MHENDNDDNDGNDGDDDERTAIKTSARPKCNNNQVTSATRRVYRCGTVCGTVCVAATVLAKIKRKCVRLFFKMRILFIYLFSFVLCTV